jgi:hypothetical protein
VQNSAHGEAPSPNPGRPPVKLESVAAIFGTAAFAAGALLYFLGRKYHEAALAHYGLDGIVHPEPFEAMLDGLTVLPELFVGLSLAALLSSIAYAFLKIRGYSHSRPVLVSAVALAFALGTVSIILHVRLQGDFLTENARLRAKNCTPCFVYVTTDSEIRGYPVLSDDSGAVIAIDGETARVIKWADVIKATRTYSPASETPRIKTPTTNRPSPPPDVSQS